MGVGGRVVNWGGGSGGVRRVRGVRGGVDEVWGGGGVEEGATLRRAGFRGGSEAGFSGGFKWGGGLRGGGGGHVRLFTPVHRSRRREKSDRSNVFASVGWRGWRRRLCWRSLY